MFNFDKFYQGLFNRTVFFDNYWDQFPTGHLLRFKEKTLPLLIENISQKDEKGLSCTIAVICHDGADEDYTDILLSLVDQKWHILEEDIVTILEFIKDPKSVDKLYALAIDIPDDDEMCALAKKCMWALSAINTHESIDKLKLLATSDDQIIRENAIFQLENVSPKY